MNPQNIESQVNQLRTELIDLMNQIEILADNYKYPNTTSTFTNIKNAVLHPIYDIVICGEVKKGKSTLLNAIIGQDILPVDNEIATSQVFRITNSIVESFYLVFNDGSQMAITREELPKYGSQVDANLHGNTDLKGKVISYIQINIPITFLPDNVSLVDTPGLGAIYKSHEWITQNYVKKATAVIFVFDPKTPLVKQEQLFIEKILDITSNLMFVMTKIDTVTPSEWVTQLRRTEENLSKLFIARKLQPPTIYPISSTTLRDVAEEDDEEFKTDGIQASLFPIIKNELMALITKTVALGRSSIAIYESHNHIQKTLDFIGDLLKVSAEEGQQLNEQFMQNKIGLENELHENWSCNSPQYRQLTEDVNCICNNVINHVSQMFRMTSPIREYYTEKIRNMSTMDEVRNLGETMPQAVVNDISMQWESIMSEAEQEVSALINMAEFNINSVSHNINDISFELNALNLTFNQKLSYFKNDIFNSIFIGGLISLISAPIGIVVAIGKTIWDLFSGGSSSETEIEKNKIHFIGELNKLFDKLNSQLCDVTNGQNRSVVNEFIFSLKNAAKDALNRLIASKKEEIQKQLLILENQSQLSIKEKQKECELLKNDMIKWNNLIPLLKEIVSLHNSIEQNLR